MKQKHAQFVQLNLHLPIVVIIADNVAMSFAEVAHSIIKVFSI